MTWRKSFDRRVKFYTIDLENINFNKVKHFLKKWSGEVVKATWMREKLVKKFGKQTKKFSTKEDPWPAFWQVLESCIEVVHRPINGYWINGYWHSAFGPKPTTEFYRVVV